jgi:hypothetical protein
VVISKLKFQNHLSGLRWDSFVRFLQVAVHLQVPKLTIFVRSLHRQVEYSGGYEIFNPQRFGQEFVDTVANPRDIVQFYRRKTAFNKTSKSQRQTIVRKYVLFITNPMSDFFYSCIQMFANSNGKDKG